MQATQVSLHVGRQCTTFWFVKPENNCPIKNCYQIGAGPDILQRSVVPSSAEIAVPGLDHQSNHSPYRKPLPKAHDVIAPDQPQLCGRESHREKELAGKHDGEEITLPYPCRGIAGNTGVYRPGNNDRQNGTENPHDDKHLSCVLDPRSGWFQNTAGYLKNQSQLQRKIEDGRSPVGARIYRQAAEP